jgi:hypothetical protein
MQYQTLEKGSALKEDVSAEDDLDNQYLSMLIASEKEKDFKSYARMRQIRVRLIRIFDIIIIKFRISDGNWRAV